VWQQAFYALKKKTKRVQEANTVKRNDFLSCYVTMLVTVAPIGWLWRWVLLCAYIMILPLDRELWECKLL